MKSVKSSARIIALLTVLLLLFSACGGSQNQQATAGTGAPPAATTAQATAANAASTEAPSAESAASEAATTAAATTTAATTAVATTAATTAAAETTAATTAAADDGVIKEVTLNVASSWSGTYEPGSMQQEIFDEVKRRIYDVTGFTIDFKIYSADYQDYFNKFSLWVATNELDMVYAEFKSAKTMGYFDSGDVLYPYTMDMLEKYAPHLISNNFLDKDFMEKNCIIDGAIRFIPLKQSLGGTAVNHLIPWIRKDLLDKAGLDIPKTFSEFEAALKAFREMEPGIVAIDTQYGERVLLETFFYGLSVPEKQTDDNGDLLPCIMQYYFKTPEFKEYLATVARFYKEGYMGSEFYIWDSNKHVENRNAGKTGASSDGYWTQRTFDRQADLYPDNPRPEGVPYMNWVPMNPVADDGRPILLNRSPRASFGNGFMIFKSTKHPEACLAAIDWDMSSVDGYVLLKFGIEGKQWELKDNAISKIPENEGTYVDILAEVLPYPDLSDAIEMQWRGIRNDFMIAFDHEGLKAVIPIENYPMYDFSSLGTLEADLQSMLNERVTNIIIGDLPVDAVDQLIADMDAAGFQTYMDEKNRQWREYKAQNPD